MGVAATREVRKFCEKYLGKNVRLGKKMIFGKVMAKTCDAGFM